MRKINDCIDFIVESQKMMGYHMPSIINDPATSREIKQAEQAIGIKFNDELKDLYLRLNGIHNDRKTPLGLTGIIPIYSLLSLKDAIDYASYMDWVEHKEMYQIESDLGHKLFPFIHDGAGNCYWVDLNEETPNFGKIYWTNTFGDPPDYLFNSLTDFFFAIQRGYADGIFFIDKDGYLNCDYDKWGIICHKLDTSIRYWKEWTTK